MNEPATPAAVGSSEGLGPLPEPRMWYDHATQRCSGMAPVGGTNERLWDASDMRAYAASAVAAERERWVAYLRNAARVARNAGGESNARMLENHAAWLERSA